MRKDIIVIPDLQVKKGVPTSHINAVAKYIWKVKPEHVVNIGDTFDFESLSFYASPLESEGRRLKDDLDAGVEALSIIPNWINYQNKLGKKKVYRPNMEFIMGNHEERLNKLVNKMPHLAGFVDLDARISKIGWTVHDFLNPLWIDGIMFNHYLANPQSGKAIGGGVENKMNKHPHSFVHGHQQQYQYGRRQTMDGRPHFGVTAGAFYQHDEDYRGSLNTEIRGFVHLVHFINRYGYSDYDVNFISIERLMTLYGDEPVYINGVTANEKTMLTGDINI